MENELNKKIVTIIVVILVLLSIYLSAVIVFDWYRPEEKKHMIKEPPYDITIEDERFIRSITENLSKVIKNNTKGRAFGTPGERYAASEIIQPNLSSILGAENVELEKIENIPPGFDWHIPVVRLTEKLDVTSFNIRIPIVGHHEHDADINDKVNSIMQVNEYNLSFGEAHIQPMWRWRFLQNLIPVENKTDNELTSNLGLDLTSEYVVNNIFNESWLNTEESYENLALRERPDPFWFVNIICSNSTTLELYKNIVEGKFENFASILKYFLENIQEKYKFRFGDLQPGEKLSWYDNKSDVPPTDNEDIFLYFNEDRTNNPNATADSPAWQEFEEWLEKHPILNSIRSSILRAYRIIEMWIWNLTSPNCKGLLIYDFNDETYDMVYKPLKPLPTFYIPGFIGQKIANNPERYKLNIEFEQEFEKSVESYNVIGNLESEKETDKTVIICCLYDSWWNQGTADAAIGVGILLFLADCFKKIKDQTDFKPDYNLKFIAFCGEEYGLRGAYYYEAAHPKEDICYVIDLNQLGFSQSDPKLDFYIYVNDYRLKSQIEEITERTDYENRVDNIDDFKIIYIDFLNPGPPSDYTPFNVLRRSECKTICFLKDTSWVLHHRDGMKNWTDDYHTAGDTMEYYYPEDVKVTAEMIRNVTWDLLSKENKENKINIVNIIKKDGLYPLIIIIIIIIALVILIWRKNLTIDKFLSKIRKKNK